MNELNIKTIIEEEIAKIGLGWDIKGILDSQGRIYTITNDTKLISKVFELVTTPIICDIAQKYNIEVIESDRQTVYPDLTLILPNKKKIALDIKSTYRRNGSHVAGFTLGSYTGYLRSPMKNIMFPYNQYSEHWVMGFIYSRQEGATGQIVTINEVNNIEPTIEEIEIIVQPKYKIAADRPGSGNTANIGSTTEIEKLRDGKGVFADQGEHIFEDYWRNFLQRKIALDKGIKQPYHNLSEYLEWKKKGK